MIYDTSSEINRERAKMLFERLIRDEKIVEVKEVKPIRSLSQNRYLHLVMGFFSLETGYNTEESKQIYKRVNRSIYYYEKKGLLFVRSSADLNSKEMTDSIEKFRDYCLENLGFTPPSPEDKAILNAISIEMNNQNL